MKIEIIDGFTRPKAKLDNIFVLKRELIRFGLRLAELRRYTPELIFVLEKHITTSIVKSITYQHYQNFLHTRLFDDKVFQMMMDEATDMREGYYQFQYSPTVMEKLNKFRGRPRQFSPPLTYLDYSEGNLRNRKIISLYTGKFWGKIEYDCYNHPTMVIRNPRGGEQFFSYLIPGDPYPTFHQPFLTAKGIERLFERYNTTFDETYLQVKGLFNMWYGMKF